MMTWNQLWISIPWASPSVPRSQASKPYNSSLARGRTNWYNPKNIRREQCGRPIYAHRRRKRENVTVLAMKVFSANLGVPNSDLWSWGGVMKYGNQLISAEEIHRTDG